MSAITMNYPRFDVVEYIKKLRNAGMSQEMAEVQGQEFEHVIIDIKTDIKHDLKHELRIEDLATNANLVATKKDLQSNIMTVKEDLVAMQKDLVVTQKNLEIAIEKVRYDALKFTIWTGVAVIITLGGMLAKGFHWL